MSELIRGKDTSEGRRSAFVVGASVILPILSLLCEIILNQQLVDGTVAVAAGLVSSAIASLGFSHSRATVKRAHMQAEAIKKKPVVLWQEKSKDSG